MPCRHHIRAQLLSRLQEGVELDFPVAEHIRVWGASGFIFAEHIVHHPLSVLVAEVNEIEGYAYFSRHHLRDEAVFLPFAVSVKGACGVVPVLHEQGEYIVSGPLQKQGCDAGIDSSGESNADFHNFLYIC